MHRTLALLATVAALAPCTLLAQEAEFTSPPAWRIRADDAGADLDDVYFVDMPPGWHVTTGPAVILWDPAEAAEGIFRLEADTYLFDPGGRREGFGIFVGGTHLAEGAPRYLYFLIRDGGEYLVGVRDGDQLVDLRGWATSGAVRSFADRPSGAASVQNVLSLEARRDELRFAVNGEQVASIPRDDVPVVGIVGLRVSHGLNLHVARLEIRRR